MKIQFQVQQKVRCGICRLLHLVLKLNVNVSIYKYYIVYIGLFVYIWDCTYISYYYV